MFKSNIIILSLFLKSNIKLLFKKQAYINIASAFIFFIQKVKILKL